MRVTVDPPLNRWKLGAGERRSGDRAWMGPANDRPIIATGHQAWLWHPGILAKDIAAVEAGRQLGAQVVHLVVDHDTQDAMTLDLPVVCGEPGSERLDVATVELGHVQTGVPTGMQPPFNANAMAKRIGDAVQRIGANGGHIAVDSQPILSAMEATDGVATLAEQMTSVIVQLMPPIVGDVAFVNSSDMLDNDVGRALVQRMLEDAQCCVARFNDAVTTHHDAGVRALRVERERVELPLWHIAWEQPRQRVFADVSDSKPLLVNEAGEVLELADDHAKLAPRALLLSAMMRTWYCDLFIHGKSGGVYDAATEAWWQNWHDALLGPMAVVSADVTLDFDVPLATREQYERAKWFAHHLPHNIDRHLGLEGERVQRKHELLAHMDDDRDRKRRQAAFKEIHRINQALAVEHSEWIERVRCEVERCRIGLANRRIATKRNWCLGLYPPKRMEQLREALR